MTPDEMTLRTCLKISHTRNHHANLILMGSVPKDMSPFTSSASIFSYISKKKQQKKTKQKKNNKKKQQKKKQQKKTNKKKQQQTLCVLISLPRCFEGVCFNEYSQYMFSRTNIYIKKKNNNSGYPFLSGTLELLSSVFFWNVTNKT